jgi:hypothetical protein
MKWIALVFSRLFNALSVKWLVVIIPRESAGHFWLMSQGIIAAQEKRNAEKKRAADDAAARWGGYQ